jgi:hypothetical protein
MNRVRDAIASTSRLLLSVAAGAFLLSVLSCSRAGTFRDLAINPEKLTATWSGREWNVQRDGRVFYQVWSNQRGRHFIDELELPVGSLQQYRYNSFHVDGEDRLITRSKYQELLSGPYGIVYAETTYHYADDYKGDNWTTSFETALYLADLPHEPAQIIDSLPSTGRLDITALSVIRVFRTDQEYVVASANYAPDGHLESISVSASKDGKWLGNRFTLPGTPRIGAGTLIGDHPSTRIAFGLPREFRLAAYLTKAVPLFGPAILPSTIDVVNLHYNRNRWVRQDSFENGGRATRILAFRFTDEDKALEAIDRQRLFGEYAYTRDPNWEKQHSD